MSNFILDSPKNDTFQELLSNGVMYQVPRFQRDYAWDKEQWEDLWSDIESLDDENYHYMWYIVLQTKKGNVHQIVIDGQQRLVTMSLIILAAMAKIDNLINQGSEPKNNKERLEEIYNRFIGSKDLVSLKVNSKLSLNRNNNVYYRSICSNLNPPNQRAMTKTNVLLKQAFEFFSKKDMGESGESIARFIEGFSSRIIFTKIVVQSTLNAYKVFETLNARGVKLSTPDLIKNYIFSIITKNNDVTDEALDAIDEDWATIISQLGEGNFTTFVRYHHLFIEGFVRKNDMFKSIRTSYLEAQDAYKYLYSLKKYAPIYTALQNPYDEWWEQQHSKYREARHYLEGLKLFGIKQPLIILMTAYDKFSTKEFLKTLKYFFALAIRYKICRRSPNEQEQKFSQIGKMIYSEKLTRASHVKNSTEFKSLYPDDETFQRIFETYKMSDSQSKKIRFLLAEIENHGFSSSTDYKNTTLEHVFPKNAAQNWQEYFGNSSYDISNRLGNMVLLKEDNLQQKDFTEKKVFYSNSNFRLARKVAQYTEWNQENLNQYQIWLAEQAVKTWRVE